MIGFKERDLARLKPASIARFVMFARAVIPIVAKAAI